MENLRVFLDSRNDINLLQIFMPVFLEIYGDVVFYKNIHLISSGNSNWLQPFTAEKKKRNVWIFSGANKDYLQKLSNQNSTTCKVKSIWILNSLSLNLNMNLVFGLWTLNYNIAWFLANLGGKKC